MEKDNCSDNYRNRRENPLIILLLNTYSRDYTMIDLYRTL